MPLSGGLGHSASGRSRKQEAGSDRPTRRLGWHGRRAPRGLRVHPQHHCRPTVAATHLQRQSALGAQVHELALHRAQTLAQDVGQGAARGAVVQPRRRLGLRVAHRLGEGMAVVGADGVALDVKALLVRVHRVHHRHHFGKADPGAAGLQQAQDVGERHITVGVGLQALRGPGVPQQPRQVAAELAQRGASQGRPVLMRWRSSRWHGGAAARPGGRRVGRARPDAGGTGGSAGAAARARARL